ncbi:MAG: DUF6134 family protein [Azospirillaceae bacterium]|nr:DUF6134 family protein [Azospirillaceae bacterium]
MSSPSRSLAVLVLTTLTAALCPPAAASPATETHLDFTVLKDGSPIGQHHIDLKRDGDTETVAIRTNVQVRVAFVVVYRFEHSGTELWRGGHLVTLHTQTNDDGNRHAVTVTAAADHLDIEADGTRHQSAAGIIPASLWNQDLVRQSTLLNTLTGAPMSVTVADLGTDTIAAHTSPTPAHHFKITGELERDLWYDPSGTLVQVEFKAQDGADIRYVLG